MSHLGPVYTAIAVFPLLAAATVLPYVALQYRRRGTVGAGHLAIAGAFGLYLVGLAFLVILPLRPVTPDFCQVYGVDPKLDPFFVLSELRIERASGGWRAVLGNPDFQETVLNVMLFVPLGIFLRHLLRRGVWVTVTLGFAVSLAIELTQLTGNWGLYPCAYRFFTTLDLVTNTTGTAIGVACAPLLRLVPAQPALRDPGQPQPVTWRRRLLAALCNSAGALALGLVLIALSGLVLEVTRGQLFESDSVRAEALRAITLVIAPGLLVFLVVPLAWGGRTPGEWAVLIEPQAGDARAPDPQLIVTRFLSGPAPLIALASLGVAGSGLAWLAFLGVAIAQAALVLRARSVGPDVELRLGLRLTDSR